MTVHKALDRVPCSGSTDARLHGALDFSLALSLFDRRAFVVLGLAFCERNFAFHTAAFPVQVEWNQREAALVHFADQALNLIFVHQKLFGARCVRPHVRAGADERVDLAADEIQLTVAHDDIPICELDLTCSQGLDLPAFEYHSGFKSVFDLVVEQGLFVFGNATGQLFFGFVCWFSVGHGVTSQVLEWAVAQATIV